MKVVRDRRDARWLPSRFHFALFRLFAYLRLRTAKPQLAPGLVMVVDPYQSAAENHLVSTLIFVVLTSFIVTLLNPAMSLPAACAIALPAAAVIIQALPVLCGTVIMPVVRKVVPIEGDNLRANSVIIMSLAIAAAIFTLRSDSPARYIAGAFLLLLALNIIASALMFFLRSAIADAERKFGVAS